MARLFACLCLVLPMAFIDAAVITNAQLLQLLQENQGNPGSSVREYGIPYADVDGVSSDISNDDVIELPGNVNGEVDTDTLMQKLGVVDLIQDTFKALDDPLVGDGCSCEKESCTCCIGKKITLTVSGKEISTSIHACVTVRYVPTDTKFRLILALNGKTVYDEEVSLLAPPKVCARMTGEGIAALVCLDIYNVDVSSKSLCTRLIGVLTFTNYNKSLYFSWGIACFKIPGALPAVTAERLLN